ncbi:magnesium transporter [Caulobacter sp. D4A]|uniref:MgtC/SapB family protein n=1 Tax=unclassified Caulobacter TaxID=2648921 RepID=UPI000D73D801|nr:MULTISPECIES: MgtC/SapB family protein [unclassified Caulobacter]PXA89231.1 magnesium transporter [Caulobacter sp. D5]PXA92049.1 magnesium transporter [Caulobacter sp. D4A]
MDAVSLHYILPVLGALAAGGAVGFEREYRSRPAGLRTHMLVSLASALLMLAAVHQLKWMGDTPLETVRIDPVRMAHGVLTGVGFLCGGVIFQQGVSVHGLTTAASLWITAALGMLFGMALYDLAIAGTVLSVVVLSAARWLDRRMPQKNYAEIAVRFRRDALVDEGELRGLLAGYELEGGRINQRLIEGGTLFELSGPFSGKGALRLGELARHLEGDERVVEFDILPRKD